MNPFNFAPMASSRLFRPCCYAFSLARPGHRAHVAALAIILLSAMSPVAARASLVISNFNQGFSLNASSPNDPATVGGFNGSLPPINYSEGLTNGIKETWITQTIFTYSGPLVIGRPTTNLFVVDLLATAGTWGGGSASTDFTLDFTLDFGESFSYSRLTPAGRAGDVKLLIEGRTGNYVEVEPGNGTLGSGNYSLQVRATDTRGSSVRLEIGSPTPVPEPTTFSLIILAACGLVSRRLKS